MLILFILTETNVLGTINILEAYKYCKNLKLVLVVTSDKCYHGLKVLVTLNLTQWEGRIRTVVVKARRVS